jgi:hypothetical protein
MLAQAVNYIYHINGAVITAVTGCLGLETVNRSSITPWCTLTKDTSFFVSKKKFMQIFIQQLFKRRQVRQSPFGQFHSLNNKKIFIIVYTDAFFYCPVRT